MILFFAANWQEIPRWGKLALVFGGVIGSYAAGWWLQFENGNYPKLGYGLILLGSILFGSAIWLIAQIYNISAHYPNGVLFWALGVLPVAWIVRSRLVLGLGTLLVSLWTVLEQGGFENPNYLFLLVFGLLVIPQVYRMECRWSLAAALISFGIWVALAAHFTEYQAFVVQHPEGRNFGTAVVAGARSIIFLGLFYFLLGIWHEKKIPGLADPYRILGILLALGGSYFFTFDITDPNSVPGPAGFTLALILQIALLAGAVFVLAGSRKLASSPEDASSIKWLWLASFLVITGAIPLNWSSREHMLLHNLILFLEILGLLWWGSTRRQAIYINLALLAFMIDLTTRYFDFFWTLMDRSIVLIIGGILLLGVAWFLEWNRRRIIRSWEVAGDDG